MEWCKQYIADLNNNLPWLQYSDNKCQLFRLILELNVFFTKPCLSISPTLLIRFVLDY